MATAAFLYRIKWRFQMKKKIERFGKEWVAMSRADWAKECGLTIGEFKNRALPRLREQPFVTIRQMKLNPIEPKVLWVHLDPDWLDLCTTPFDMDPIQTGMIGPGQQEEWTAYPYKNPEEQKFKKAKTSGPTTGKSVAELLKVSKTVK